MDLEVSWMGLESDNVKRGLHKGFRTSLLQKEFLVRCLENWAPLIWMAQPIKVPVAKSNDLNLIPGTCLAEGENQLLQVVI